ncbi:hypothetical protein [Chamaesiphon sp.]|uniref:hypothetical protein n=1 Tax=Chamaesiphon sp. TaxID=2814140 RepID=UPI00359426A3
MNYRNYLLRYYLISSKQKESGYAMLIVSLIIIILLGLLAAFLRSSQTSLDTTNAFTDGNNTFYAAESALNNRAEKLRQTFIGFNRPSGLSPGQTLPTDPVTQANVATCFIAPVNVDSTTDFGCENTSSSYIENRIANVFANAGGGGSTAIVTDRKPTNYNAYTFVTDTTSYVGTSTLPNPIVIPADEVFGGLNALEYKYTVFASAVNINPVNEASPLDTGFAQSILQMDIKNRVVPLFQFQIFSDRDLEITSGLNSLSGRVHANGNLYIQSYDSTGVTINKKVTSAADIYNRIDSSCTEVSGTCSPAGTISVLSDAFPAYQSIPLTLPQLAGMSNNVKDFNTVKSLVTPDLPFLRKRNYKTGVVGDYFGKADLRIEMVPDRIVPFDLTAIQTGSSILTGACNITPPVMGSDPSIDYIDPKRQGTSPVCAKLNVGQLMSLQQPVLVLAKGNTEEEARFCQASVGDRVRDLISYGSYAANPTMAGLSVVQQDKILQALRVAIASSTTPLDYGNAIGAGILPVGVKVIFGLLLTDPTLAIGLSGLERAAIISATPASLAKARSGCFLPAPISLVKTGTGVSGVFDQRRNRSMTVLQTNIESLTLWNRDGWHVNMGTNPLVTPTVTLSNITTSLNTSTNSTNSLLFARAPVNGSTIGSFNYLGLGATDRTEGGLVIHAVVNDNLSGDGSVGAATNATASASDPIVKTSPKDRAPVLDNTGNPVVLDYYRRYKGGATQQSPYGFAFSRGANLPAPLTIATDQGAYLLGDWNTIDYQPASLLADDITALSNNCVSPETTIDPNQVRTGEMNCAIPATTVGIVPWTGNAIGDYTGIISSSTVGSLGKMYNAFQTTYNLALLTGKIDSIGNTGINRGSAGGGSNGGLINYFSLLEFWSADALFYKGSMLQIGNSLESNPTFKRAGTSVSYYYPARSTFRYDPNFDTFLMLPPLTPRSVYLIQSVLSQ